MQPGLPLRAGQIQIWVCRDARIQAAELRAHYASVLSNEELERLSRFHYARHRHQYLVTRAMVRHVLSLYRPGIAPQQWRFCSNPHGKPAIEPALDPAPPLHFNVSHTDGLIVMAVSRQAIGIDVEDFGRSAAASSVADTFFAPIEQHDLKHCAAAQQQRRFFELWTLKEAYVKARGEGLAVPLDSFSFRLGARGPHSLEFSPVTTGQQHWRFWSARLLPRYCLAVAACRDESASELSLSVAEIIPCRDIFSIRCVCVWQDPHGPCATAQPLPAIACARESWVAATYQCL